MFQKFFPKFKVVEINDAPALRNGHMLAQSPAYAANAVGGNFPVLPSKTVGDYKFIENGIIVGLGSTGVLEAFDIEKHAIPFLHFTEELTSGPLDGLNQFAIPTEAGVPVYPRCIALYVGTTFTTDNYTAGTGAFADVVDGVLTIGASGPFVVKASTLPNGDTAMEFTYLGYPIIETLEGAQLTAHIADTTNPHEVTKAQVGLGDVDNTADLDKPVSTATTQAIQDAIAGL